MDFSEKLKQIRKSEGKPLLGYFRRITLGTFHKISGQVLI